MAAPRWYLQFTRRLPPPGKGSASKLGFGDPPFSKKCGHPNVNSALSQRNTRSKDHRRTVLGMPAVFFAAIIIVGAAVALVTSAVMLPHSVGGLRYFGESIYYRIYALFGFEEPLMVTEKDLQLFQRALDSSKEFQIPHGPVKIAFMFLTRGPLPLALLWERFFKGHNDKYSIYIHADPGYTYSKGELPKSFVGRAIASEPVTWSSLSMVAAERRLLATALLDQKNWYFVLLSEACIPLHSFPTVYTYITKSRYSFVTITQQEDTWKPDMLPEVPLSRWRKGDEWKELHRSLALIVINDTKYFKKFTRHCACRRCDWHKVGASDEHYIPTLLFNSRSHLLANRTLTWVDWKNHDQWEHPHTYQPQEVTKALIKELQGMTIFRPFAYDRPIECSLRGQPRTCFMFARKFANTTLRPLLRLAPSVMGY